MENKKIVIIPTYNESQNIELLLKSILELDTIFHMMIVDSNSPDGTASIVKRMQKLHPDRIFLLEQEEKEGLGRAYIAGFKKAINMNYDYIIEMDADFSHNPKDIIRLYKTCKENCDLSVGSRYIKGVNVVNWPLRRVLLSYMASYYVRIITGMPILDPTAGFVCYKKKVIEGINLDEIHSTGYAFQIEMKYQTWKKGFQIKEIPIIFIDRVRGESKMSMSIVREAILSVLKLRIKNIFSKLMKSN